MTRKRKRLKSKVRACNKSHDALMYPFRGDEHTKLGSEIIPKFPRYDMDYQPLTGSLRASKLLNVGMASCSMARGFSGNLKK